MIIAGRSFFHKYHQLILLGILLLLVLVSAVSFWKFGPYFSPDTTNYFLYALDMQEQKALYGTAYSPLYPWLLSWAGLIGIGPIPWATCLIIGLYGLNAIVVYQWGQLIHRSTATSIPKWAIILLPLIMLHVWWSFRMISWAHADGVFYTVFLFWLLYGLRLLQRFQKSTWLVFSLLGAALIWIKLNAVMLIPFLGLLWWFDSRRFRWVMPFFAALLSYLIYQLVFPGNVLSSSFSESFSSSFPLLISYLSSVCRVSLGFMLSDHLTDILPDFIATPGGLLLIGGMFYYLWKWRRGEVGMKSFLLLFAVTYLFCFLAFQFVIGFEEINFRTLFPYFWALFGAFLIWTLEKGWFQVKWVLPLAFLLFAHTVAGHYLYFKKDYHNALFEAEEVLESELLQELKWLLETAPEPYVLYSDHPEMLSFALQNKPVYFPTPKRYFRAGRSRPLSLHEQQKFEMEFKERMKNGAAILVLFLPDKWSFGFENQPQLAVRHFTNGALVIPTEE